ncbi:hypothetical protein VOLCADRAFT_79814 [Volvox carteri f. nagariensis]|uniref:SRP54-type proteins GTP-binding domain-containing protein n=1 Tax=Volvox carteri f. nagariensis TaxID=3068 RepID=D8TMX0_VOLCA|nr:uncharacterized protein VOLCADRAFT_79814 [Volvox carteri f. nagariensis]EFJ51325.1 hypothetical protein VOLCADRAFT_79814 [Volvox carteri f. nagariensis]|eukprot:XP_002947792.1 hypothetical protein VOLCADRAFT_79814 [Volvox carteri f. nagariensis]
MQRTHLSRPQCGGSALSRNRNHTVVASFQTCSRRGAIKVRASGGNSDAGGGGGAGLLQRLGRVIKEKAAGDFDRFFKGTSKTRERLGLVDELLALWSLEDYEESLEELEEVLISADFGPRTALKIVDRIRDGVKSGTVKSADDTRAALKSAIVELLTSRGAAGGRTSELRLQGRPAAVLIVGVNGAGKTTTVGKLAYKYGKEGAKVFLIPGDTFRAAAAEQLAEWGRRAGATLGTFREGARPQAVIASRACKDPADVYDLVLVDTAGRLHTAYKLMEELQLCKSAVGTALTGQPDETLLVLDGTTGLNMLNQAREFNDAVKLTGLILTKLDGTARGGAVVSVVDQLGLPVKFIGVGETAEDLQPFDAEAFAEALFPREVAVAAK